MDIKLFTTPKIPLVGNSILLPRVPVGDILRNEGVVYSSDGIGDNYSGVSVIATNGHFYAQFEDDVEGFAVVSYLTDFKK